MSDNIQIKFPSEDAAKQALTAYGFSLGTSQRNDPRGIMHGDYLIMKWRNLSNKDKDDLHGAYHRHGYGGPVSLWMKPNCPPKALARLTEMSAA